MTFLRRGVATMATVSLISVVAPGASAAEMPAVAPGVSFETFTETTAHGDVVGYLIEIHLGARAWLGLLHPAAIAETERVSEMAATQYAVAGVNGDFFNISEREHPGVDATGSSVGPEITEGRGLKAAVPDGQTFGPFPPAGESTRDVFGVGVDGRARTGTVTLHGSVRTGKDTFEVQGLNQYAIPVNGIGVFTHDWGAVSRARAACGTDTSRAAPCSTDTEEVVVHDGVVASEAVSPGAGEIPAGTFVLLGRESGAERLRRLQPGDHVDIRAGLDSGQAPPFVFAVGGFRILSGGEPLSGLDSATLAPRTAAGTGADGRTVYLVAVDGRSTASTGMTVAELAGLLRSYGARDAVNLDGGGSTTVVVGGRGQRITVRNVPSDGTERAVANGVGVFTAR